jgi:hypothetical protein
MVHASPEGGTEDNSHTPPAVLWLGLPVGWCFSVGCPSCCRPPCCLLLQALGVACDQFCPSPTATVRGLLPLSLGWSFSVSGPFRCRPFPQAFGVTGTRFRPSPTATVHGLLPLSFAGFPRVGITLWRRRADSHRRSVYSNLGRAPAGAGFRASACFTSPRLQSLVARRGAHGIVLVCSYSSYQVSMNTWQSGMNTW